MILKEKEFTNPSDPRFRAGEEAEKQLAFRLSRAFKKRGDAFVINDLRVVYDGDAAQIDHLIVSPYGLFIIESKSCYGTIAVNEFNEWSRTFNGKPEGMQSPILQAEEQGRVLKELLIAQTENLLGKILGSVQRGFGYCPVLSYVAVSDCGMIDRKDMVARLYKADDAVKAVTSKFDELKKSADPRSPKFWLSTEVGWRMKLEEAKVVAEFLLAQHQPISQAITVKNGKGASLPKVAPVQMETTFVPKVGAKCPECGVAKLIRRSVKRSDGTETDFLACQGYPSSCKALFPLVAISSILRKGSSVVPVFEKAIATNSIYIEGHPCPRCKDGKLVKRKSKTEFLGCSNYPKCKFTDYRDQSA